MLNVTYSEAKTLFARGRATAMKLRGSGQGWDHAINLGIRELSERVEAARKAGNLRAELVAKFELQGLQSVKG